MRAKCWICASFAGRNLKAVIRHIGAVHARDPDFHVVCGIQGCVRTYKNYSSFKKHMYRHHKDQLDPVHPDSREPSATEASMQSEMTRAEDEGQDLWSPNNSDAGYDHTEQAALFVLKAKHVHNISQSALNNLLFDVSTMISDRVRYIENKVHHQLSDSSSSTSALEAFHHPAIIDPFRGLTTRYLQLKYYRESFGLLVCAIKVQVFCLCFHSMHFVFFYKGPG